MTEHQAVQTSPPSSLQSLSRDALARAEAALTSPRPVNEATRLLPSHVCDAMLERLHGETPEVGRDRASGAVAMLLSGYPQATMRGRNDGQEMDLATYAKTLARTIAKFPEYAVMGMIDRKPWGHAFLPSEPEIKTALQDEVTRRAVIIANAKAHKREAIRRQKQDEEDARLAATRGATEAERKLQVQAILAKFNRMDGDAT